MSGGFCPRTEIYKLTNDKFIDIRITVTQSIPLILLLMLSRYFFHKLILIAPLSACSSFSVDSIILFENLDGSRQIF